jgi:putative membrane protein
LSAAGSRLEPLPAEQKWALWAVLTAVPLSAWGALYPPNTWLQVGPILVIVALLWRALRKHPLSNASVNWIVGFLLLHLFAARWSYSFVPYDEWSQALTGIRLNAAFGFERNMFDRLVHFAFGLCCAAPITELCRRHLMMSAKVSVWVMLLFVLGTGGLYEIFEWLLSITMDPASADAYNGQQGDLFDPQQDMLIAAFGAVVGLFLLKKRVLVLLKNRVVA